MNGFIAVITFKFMPIATFMANVWSKCYCKAVHWFIFLEKPQSLLLLSTIVLNDYWTRQVSY